MNGWMDEWMNGRTSGQMDGWMDGRTDELTDEWMDDIQIGDRWIERQTIDAYNLFRNQEVSLYQAKNIILGLVEDLQFIIMQEK